MNIKWIILDVDGVLTDGKLIYTSDGQRDKRVLRSGWLRPNGCS